MNSNNSFWNELMNLDNVTTTTNGDKAYKSSMSGLIDLIFKAGVMKHCTANEAIDLFLKAYEEHPIAAIRILFYIRDIRGGQGCRSFFRYVMNYLKVNKPLVFNKIVYIIPEYGRWDDLICLMENDPHNSILIDIIKKQVVSDINNMKDNKPISLIFKWLPSENTSSKKTVFLAKIVRKALNLDSRSYRKMLSAGRKYLDIVEHHVCTETFSDIKYDTVPSIAMMKYRNIFNTKDEKHFNEYISSVAKGETKINAKTLYPYDIVHAYWGGYTTAEEEKVFIEQWKALPDFFEGMKDNSIVVADVSGSMTGTPIEACLSLALYIAERNKGDFHNKFITFSANPTLIQIPSRYSNIIEKLKYINNAEWGMNTDIDAVFRLMFNAAKNCTNKEDIPSTIYIVSDMQFDQCCENSEKSVFEKWTDKFKKELDMDLPKIIFWNVSEWNCGTVPITVKDNGVICISGFSPVIVKYIMSNPSNNTMELIKNIINNERYNKILDDIEDYSIF